MIRTKVIALAVLFALATGTAFAVNVKIGKYVAGDSRNDLDYDYWLELRADRTVILVMPGGSASGTWRYDGSKIYITIVTSYGEMAHAQGMTSAFIHADKTGNVIYGEDDLWWLQ